MESPPILLQELPTDRPRLRIAVVTETYPPEINGVAMTIGRVVQGLQQRQHRIQLIRPRQSRSDQAAQGESLEEVLARGLPIPRYDSLKVGLPAKSALVRLWSLRRPDIVHVVTEGPLGWSALAAARKLKLPVSTDFHTNFHRYSRHYGVGWLEKPIALYLRKFHNRAGCTMVPTEAVRADLRRHGYRNVEVVARGVDTTLFHPAKRSEELRCQWGAGPEDWVVIHVGRLAPEKNLPLLFQAFDALAARRPGARLVLVGDGPDGSALRGRHPRHVFAGMRQGEDLAAHYASGDLFLFPSLTETYGNVTLEAMASGLPVVAYDYAAAAEYIRHGVNGLLAPYDDGAAFVGLAAGLAGDGRRPAELGARSRQTAQGLTWERIMESFERVLLEQIRKQEAHHFLADSAAAQPDR